MPSFVRCHCPFLAARIASARKLTRCTALLESGLCTAAVHLFHSCAIPFRCRVVRIVLQLLPFQFQALRTRFPANSLHSRFLANPPSVDVPRRNEQRQQLLFIAGNGHSNISCSAGDSMESRIDHSTLTKMEFIVLCFPQMWSGPQSHEGRFSKIKWYLSRYGLVLNAGLFCNQLESLKHYLVECRCFSEQRKNCVTVPFECLKLESKTSVLLSLGTSLGLGEAK